MKNLYNSPELEIVKFATMQAVANDDLDTSDGDIFEKIPEESIEP